MSTKNTGVGEKAVSYFKQGKNCAEAVLLALSEELGISSELIPSIATGFGGGLGRNGFVCGAVSGGTMVIGLKGAGKGKRLVYPVVDKFVGDFQSRFGNVNCRELIRVDLKTEEGLAYLKEKGHKRCRGFVRFAADRVYELVNIKEVVNQP